MDQDKLMQRITINPEVCFGKPTVRNLRYPVEFILDIMASGMTTQEILEDYPDLEEEDLKAALIFASRLIKVNSIHKVKAA